MAHSTGQILNNRYRIVSLLAQGGFGAIYRAWDMNLNTPVAMKENLSSSSASLRQFTFEAQLLAKLRHENLPYVIDHFILPDQGQYLVMEFVEGKDLQSILAEQRHPFSEGDAVGWILQVSSAVAYLHSQNPPIIHRDIKPANIKITPKGKVMLVDFGIAKIYKPSQHTTIGAKAITQGYSPPEQYGGGITDARSDIYSLGATLYTLITACVPVESVQRHLGAVFLSPREIDSNISRRTETAILKAMAMNPEDRYQSADHFRQAINERAAVVQTVMTAVEIPATIRMQSRPEGKHVPASFPESLGTQINAPDQIIRIPKSRKKKDKFSLSSVLTLMFLCLLTVTGLGVGFYLLGIFPGWGFTTQTQYQIDLTSTELARLISSSTTAEISGLTSMPTDSRMVVPSLSLTAIASFTSIPIPSNSPTPVPSSTPTPMSKPTWIPCPGTYPSRLNVGDRAFVSTDPPLPNRVRTQPDPDGPIIGYLDVSEKLEILEGPVCSSTWIWWRVRSLEKHLAGWTAEGDAENYWLVPMP